MSDRRLPVYLLLDCSGGLAGDPIEALERGVRTLLSDLRGHPETLDSVALSVITFAASASQICPLTEVLACPEPMLMSGGPRALGKSLKLLWKCLDTEVRKPTRTQSRDMKPLVFLVTHGPPTDRWQDAADEVKRQRMCWLIACAVGPQADVSVLKEVADVVVQLKALQPESLNAFFKWAFASIINQVGSLSSTWNVPLACLPPPPGIQVVS